jgi:branched-chain amino acid transport system permease protein
VSMLSITGWFAIYNHTIATSMINALAALSMYYSLRAGIFNLSLTGFMALGAYTAGFLSVRVGLPTALNVIIGILLSLVVGIILVYPILRLRGHYLAIATLGFSAIVQALALNMDNVTNGPLGLVGIPVTVGIWQIGLLLVIVLSLSWIVQKTKTGRAWDAIRSDESVARCMGINVEWYKFVAFLISTLLGALAGGLWAHLNRVIVPSEFGFSQLAFVLVYALLGGITHPLGPVLGALIVTTMPDWLYQFDEYRDIVIGITLIVIVIYLPNGLVQPSVVMKGAFQKAKTWVVRRG